MGVSDSVLGVHLGCERPRLSPALCLPFLVKQLPLGGCSSSRWAQAECAGSRATERRCQESYAAGSGRLRCDREECLLVNVLKILKLLHNKQLSTLDSSTGSGCSVRGSFEVGGGSPNDLHFLPDASVPGLLSVQIIRLQNFPKWQE